MAGDEETHFYSRHLEKVVKEETPFIFLKERRNQFHSEYLYKLSFINF